MYRLRCACIHPTLDIEHHVAVQEHEGAQLPSVSASVAVCLGNTQLGKNSSLNCAICCVPVILVLTGY